MSTSTTTSLATSLGLTDLVGIVTLVIAVIGLIIGALRYTVFRKYRPTIDRVWMEGIMMLGNQVDPDSYPNYFIIARLNPKGKIIHNCEVKIADDWFAYFESNGKFKEDVARETDIQLARFVVDTKRNLIHFHRPVSKETGLSVQGSWIGLKIPPKFGRYTLEVTGEVEGHAIRKEITIDVNLKNLVEHKSWREGWLPLDKPTMNKADQMIDSFAKQGS